MIGEEQLCARRNQSPSCDVCQTVKYWQDKCDCKQNQWPVHCTNLQYTLIYTSGFYSILSFNVTFTVWLHCWASTSRWASHTVWPSLSNSLTASVRLSLCRIPRNLMPGTLWSLWNHDNTAVHQNLCPAGRVPHTQPLHSLTFLSRNWAQVGNEVSWDVRLRHCSAPHILWVLYRFTEHVAAHVYTILSP